MSQKLLDVLVQLDPAKDEHWTQDGAARLDVLQGLLGANVTREELLKAVPGFSRKNVVIGTTKTETTKTDPFSQAVSTSPFIQPDADLDASKHLNDDALNGNLHAQDNDILEDADEDELIEMAFAEATENFNKAKVRLNQATVAHDALITRRSKENAPESFSNTVKMFQKQQAAERALTSTKQQAMLKLMAEMDKVK